MRVDPGLLTLLIVIVVGFIVFAVWRTVKAHQKQATTGREELIGKTVEVKEDLNPEGVVFLEGELWQAVSESGFIPASENVVITRIDGLKLFVTGKKKEAAA
jgi:membrane-bound ClpP family serine protease